MKNAQAKITEAINANPENVIAKAIAFSPKTAQIVDEVRKAPGTLAGVAAAALKDALRGKTNEETIANMIKFSNDL